MKHNSKLFLLGLSCLLGLATACSEEEVMKQDNQNDASNIEAGSLKEALVTVADFEPAWKARTVISMENGKGNFNWADGDKIGVFPTKANDITTLKSQHVLTLRNITTPNQATFQQDGWSFTPGYDYVAHYPIINRAQIQMKEVPADYTQQTYTVPTDGKINLSAVDYMAAYSTAPEQGKKIGRAHV